MSKFSDRLIVRLKPTEKDYDVEEGNGFGLRVRPTGTRSWYYRYMINGKSRRFMLGNYPGVTLADARRKYNEAVGLRQQGLDPFEILRAEERHHTVSWLSAEYLEKWAKPRKRTWKNDEAAINNDINPMLGNMPVGEVRRRDVVRLIDSIKERGAMRQSAITLSILKKMFNYGLERDIGVEFNPCVGITPHKSQPRERNLCAEEINAFWYGLDATNVASVTQRALKLILVTMQRPGECAGLHTREIDGRWWTIPPERTKNGREQRVYLTDLALMLISDKRGYPFPRKSEDPKEKKPVTCDTLDKALGREFRRKEQKLKPRMYLDKEKKKPLEKFIPHDLRRTGATQLGELGYDDFMIGKILNHTTPGETKTYNKARYDAQKTELLVAWEKRLLEILKTPR